MEQIKSLEELVNYFNGLADGSVEPFHKRTGICHNIDTLFEGHISTDFIYEGVELLDIKNYYHVWSHFSGDISYPVPDPSGKLAPDEVYTTTTHKWEGNYGDLRKDLCRHIAKEIEKLIPVE